MNRPLLLCAALLAFPVLVIAQDLPQFDFGAAKKIQQNPDAQRQSRQCPAENPPAPVPPPAGQLGQMVGYYADQKRQSGSTNPAYGDAEKPFRNLRRALSQDAASYAATGSAGDAACVLSVLYTWAESNELLDYSTDKLSQGSYEVEWVAASAALAFSVVKDAPGLDQAQAAIVEDWLYRVAQRQLSLPEDAAVCHNNHYYWRGLEAMAVGTVTGRSDLVQRGVDTYRDALEGIAADGSFPREMKRNEKALHYQNFAIEPLVGIAELADKSGIDLYSQKSSSGRSIQDAVNFLLNALQAEKESLPVQGSVFSSGKCEDSVQNTATSELEAQNLSTLQPDSMYFGWTVPYSKRFGASVQPYAGASIQDWWLGGAFGTWAVK